MKFNIKWDYNKITMCFSHKSNEIMWLWINISNYGGHYSLFFGFNIITWLTHLKRITQKWWIDFNFQRLFKSSAFSLISLIEYHWSIFKMQIVKISLIFSSGIFNYLYWFYYENENNEDVKNILTVKKLFI